MTTTRKSHRISATEYGTAISITEEARSIGIHPDELIKLLARTENKIYSNLRLKNCFSIERGNFQPVDISGILRLSSGIDLEIRPKFLSGENENWREDFFSIASILKFGRILPQESLSANIGEKGDLSDLLARAMIMMYDKNTRRPLRTYRHRKWADYNIDGEIDYESIYLPHDEGFIQKGLILDRENIYNFVIYFAMATILKDLRDGDVRRKINNRILRMLPQSEKNRHFPKNLPSRHKKWQDLYELSKQICNGYGYKFGDFDSGYLPGYIIRTPDAWEALILSTLKIGLKNRNVYKGSHFFGFHSIIGKKNDCLNVEPDITIKKDNKITLLVDAKYKGKVENKLTVDRQDIYESLAFLRATGCKRAVLVYPSNRRLCSSYFPGSCGIFEVIKIENYEIIGMEVDPRGFSKVGGRRAFCKNLCQNISVLEI